MYNYKIKTSFVRPEMPKTQAKKTGFHPIVHFYIRGKLDIIRCFTSFFSMAKKPILIHRILISFETMLEKVYLLQGPVSAVSPVGLNLSDHRHTINNLNITVLLKI